MRPTKIVWAAVLGATLGLSGALPAQAEPTRPSDASYDLRQAASLVRMTKGKKGPARLEALENAARAYRQIISRHPGDAEGCARAWFELAELERRKGSLADAESAYAKAMELDRERYGVRALLEKAHVQRRLDRLDEALVSYREVVQRAPETSRAHTARVWIGGCLQIRGDLDGAVQAFAEALESTSKPTQVIDLCNRMGKAQLAAGDLEGAEAAIARADKLVETAAPEEVDRLRKALGEMSLRRALQRARDKQNGAHEDARALEQARAARR